VIFALALATGSVCCTRSSLSTDQTARDAVLALDKLQSKLDVGVSYNDYSVALGEANFATKQFLESTKASSAPEFSNSLREAMRWYVAGERLWTRQIKKDDLYGFCKPGDYEDDAKDLCQAYPEVVNLVMGKPGFQYREARQVAWNLAGSALKNAKAALKE
jgi:hypothetical protein